MAKNALKLDDDVRDVLARSAIDGTILRLPEQLDRALYTKTNKALEALGGRWDRKRKGHVFDGDPRGAIAAASNTGTVAHPNPHDFFPTPPDVAGMVADRLGALADTNLLEPSAGEGALVIAIGKRVRAEMLSRGDHGPALPASSKLVELDERRCAVLRTQGLGAYLLQRDFLTVTPAEIGRFDRIAMNPPFHRGADTAHVAHALDFLAPGGRLVAIVSGAFNSRTTKANAALLDRLGAWGATFEDLPDGSFKEAGTSVATKLLVVDRPS